MGLVICVVGAIGIVGIFNEIGWNKTMYQFWTIYAPVVFVWGCIAAELFN